MAQQTLDKQQLRHIFQSQYSHSSYKDILQHIFLADMLRTELERFTDDNAAEDGYFIGKVNTADAYSIGCFYFKINSGSVAHKKVGLRSLVKQFVNPNWGEFDAAIAVFDDGAEWRLSLISDIKGVATTPKRYSFVFGDTDNLYRTAIDRFLQIQNSDHTFTALREAFSVEALSKQFYKDLFDWYQWAIKPASGVVFPKDTDTPDDDQKDNETHLIRLITRIMFVWFIKQKSLVPNKIFDVDFLHTILKDFDPKSKTVGNYYNAILQNLFFATLNRAIVDEQGNKRRFATNVKKDIKTLYRYEDMFTISEEEVIAMFSEVPFLNGGLFECLDKTKTIDGVEKAYNYDGFSRNDRRFSSSGHYRYRATVPNILFFDEEKGLLSILNRYNFTIEENSPEEQQVALDPELLGKVFENLLGTYNPETRETARNQSGSFYTPREIVNYMVDESLIAYLGDTEFIRTLFSPEFTYDTTKDKEYEAVATKLKAVKILDPACGSGAFPMGLLNRMIDILNHITPNESTYDLKLSIIENCIYGSDIQSIAAQITKLRFFISLICDCEKDATKPNFGIPTLPNLETKFVAANSLIAKKKQGQQLEFFVNQTIEQLKDELHEVRKEHFSAKTAYQKHKLRNRDKSLREQLAKELANDGCFAPADANQLAEWNPYEQNAVASFFDPEWMFGVTDGFDIVISNPPYISTKGISNEAKRTYESEFGFSDDTYNLFTFKGISLLKQGGSLSYIIPKTFWTTQTKRSMRDLILRYQINYIFDTANPFEAVMVDTCIIQVIKQTLQKDHHIKFIDGTKNLNNPRILDSIAQNIFLNTLNSVIFKPTKLNLRIYELYGKKVKDLYEKWWSKIETSQKIANNKAELEAYRANLKPGDIALLGCLTEGGQGLATANNGKYIAVRRTTKWAKSIIESRPKKLAEAIRQRNIVIPEMQGFSNEQEFLKSLTEHKIADLFDSLKEKYGRDIFGKGYLYKIIDDSELADVNKLTNEEKENGISTTKNFYVPYDKGDKDGNRWYLETPFAIAWSKENVRYLKTDPRARYQGYMFYFREGFCWSDINTINLKCRKKERSIHDVKSMSMFETTPIVPESYIITLINSTLFSTYVDNFVNNTQTFQINDARQLPIIVPTHFEVEAAEDFVTEAITLKKSGDNSKLSNIQRSVDEYVEKIYNL